MSKSKLFKNFIKYFKDKFYKTNIAVLNTECNKVDIQKLGVGNTVIPKLRLLSKYSTAVVCHNSTAKKVLL